ncbi:MAG: HipA domain-containing protein [Sulfurimonas sp.]|nr:HipA domain-containing protein [Sulfurimonas sp.]
MKHNSLKVIIDKQEVGSIWIDNSDESYKFAYADEWKKNGYAISPNLPLNETLSSGTVKRFLENLIPEGKGLEDITAFAHISKSNTFAIIKAIGYDTSGALMFGQAQESDQAIFREIPDEELALRIAEIQEKSIVIWDKKERLSLAGVQEKLPVIIKESKIGLGDGTLSSTHIMKFQTKKQSHIVINELFCMHLAKQIGLNVAQVELKRFNEAPVLLVKRFDRVYEVDCVKRLHVIDACQMLDLSSSYKYERNFGSGRDVKDIREGASFFKLFACADSCEVPAKAKLELLNWAIFNLLIGNSDAHAKNFSFFISNHGIKPTPSYDLLCILAHEDVEHDMAMAYGDEFNPNEIKAYQLRDFADNIDINYKLVMQTIKKQTAAITKVLQERFIDEDKLLDDEKLFVKKLYSIISFRVAELEKSADEMSEITFK